MCRSHRQVQTQPPIWQRTQRDFCVSKDFNFYKPLEDMATFKVMVRWPGGQQRQELQSGCTVGEFQDIASTVTGITAQEQNITFGLPPRPLPLDSLETLLKAVGVERGDIITIDSLEDEQPEPISSPVPALSSPAPRPLSSPLAAPSQLPGEPVDRPAFGGGRTMGGSSAPEDPYTAYRNAMAAVPGNVAPPQPEVRGSSDYTESASAIQPLVERQRANETTRQ